MKKLLSITSALAIILTLATTSTVNAAKPEKARKLENAKHIVNLRAGIDRHRERAWYWQDVMFVRRHSTNYSENKTKSVVYLRWLRKTWKARHEIAKRKASQPPHYNEWLCIHSKEGSWTDPGAPYYGGLQMDESFQRSYGWRLYNKKGTADNWTPLEQMWVAERAFSSGRGFYPWPNTARYCGLI